jgi:hypothetical protein
MSIILQFIRDFLGVLFEGLRDIFFGIILGVYQVFNIPQYIRVFQFYKSDFSFVNWLVAILFVILLLAMFAATIWILVYAVQRAVRLRKNVVLPQDLLDEIVTLKKQIVRMSAEKDRILSLKVSNIGNDEASEKEGGQEGAIKEGESRFYKLTEIDRLYENYVEPVYDSEITLEQICDRFRDFAASRLKLYYEKKIVRLFFAGFSTTRLLILQGISGTGKSPCHTR